MHLDFKKENYLHNKNNEENKNIQGFRSYIKKAHDT